MFAIKQNNKYVTIKKICLNDESNQGGHILPEYAPDEIQNSKICP
jgi:hypothetical protein